MTLVYCMQILLLPEMLMVLEVAVLVQQASTLTFDLRIFALCSFTVSDTVM